jgi:excisionase family DNA binding protein
MSNPFEDITARLDRMENLLEHLSQPLMPPLPAADEIGGVDMAAAVTGLAKSTVYNFVCEGRIPHMKRGKKLYFSRSELLAWIREGKRKTQADIVKEVESFFTETPL